MKPAYNDKQIEVYNLLSSVKKEGVSSDVLNEIIFMLEDEVGASSVLPVSNDESIDSIKMKLLDEKDWRKKAILSARIISKGLE